MVEADSTDREGAGLGGGRGERDGAVTGALHVVVCENDPHHAAALRRLLQEASIAERVSSVGSLAALLSLLATDPAGIVLLSLTLPDSGGAQTLGAVRLNAPDTPVVVLVGPAEPHLEDLAIRSGYEDILHKDALDGRRLARSVRLAVERHRLRREIEQRNRELDSFASRAAHDLQAPVRRFRSLAELLEERLSDESRENAKEILTYLRMDAERMERTVKDLLQYSRSGGQGTHVVVDLAEVARHAATAVQADLDAVGGHIRIEPMPRVSGMASQLRSLFQNLFENAIRYRRPDVAPEIRAWAEVGDHLVVKVADNGRGIGVEDRSRLFEAFYRGRSSLGTQGNGLGLAICERVARAHRGAIRVESDGETGSLFVVTFPASMVA